MEVRKFRPDDLMAVARIAENALEERYSPEFLLYLWQMNPESFLVAERGGTIIGFIIATQPALRELRILMIAVDRNTRRQGVGSFLLKQLIMRFPDVRKIVLEVRPDNVEALEFYKKHGFRVKGRVDDFYTDGSAAYLMEKILF